MINDDNRRRIDAFGNDNYLMNDDVPFYYTDTRTAKLFNYIDRKIIQHWIIQKLNSKRKAGLTILDVGAGTGRMTKYFSEIGETVVSIEPYLPFFDKLKRTCINQNIECYQYTLQEYIEFNAEPFDLIYVSGVLMYHIDIEAVEFINILNLLIKPDGLILIRDLGMENHKASNAVDDALIEEGKAEVIRTPKGVLRLAHHSGLKCIKWGRPYPIDIPQKIYQKWPNKFTNAIVTIFTHRFFYPLWSFFSLFNIPHMGERCYFAYLFQKEIKGQKL
jgi:SAM-dependent methyltransferase